MSTFCTASLNYLDTRRLMSTGVDIDIRDGRAADLPAWTTCGFERIDHHSAVADWRDDHAMATIHYAELEALACAMTGADHALVSGHITRSPGDAARHEDLGPISFVHSDFAASYIGRVHESYLRPSPGAQQALDRNGVTAQDVQDASRVVILQFWRNIGPAKMDFPLAFCDARTLRADEARPIPVNDYAGSGVNFEALAVAAPDEPSRHHWYAFPELQPDEAVAFRTFDTDLVATGATFFTPHSAFRDPEVEVGQPSRVSVELRAICLFA
ncbi:MAG: CmcJ/NvfI family oxidoreductase [Actinomycetota bacterium]